VSNILARAKERSAARPGYPTELIAEDFVEDESADRARDLFEVGRRMVMMMMIMMIMMIIMMVMDLGGRRVRGIRRSSLRRTLWRMSRPIGQGTCSRCG
jgi:hypothetical protein